MNFNEFIELVELVKKQKPVLFRRESDDIPNEANIEFAEKHYGIMFPDCYRKFIKKYGGGSFAHGSIFSCDENSIYYIIKNVHKDIVKEKKILPFYDFETGDVAAFRINNEIISDKIVIYDHESEKIEETNLDFFEFVVKYALKIQW